MIKWARHDGFEEFICLFESHIGQQPNLQYIMNRVFHAIWLRHGRDRNYATVLGLGRATNVHVSIHYISEEQFVIDLNYLFSALKESLVNRGSDLIERENGTTNDGIVILYNLYERYKYDGDVQIYESNLLNMMSKKLTRNYPGGPMQYLEDWEKASIKYCKISLKTKFEFAGDTKRGIFLAMFNVKDYTSTLLDSTSDYTETFDELLALLRRRISRKNNLDAADAIANTNLIQYDAPTTNQAQRYSVTEDTTRAMRTLDNAATNTSIRNNSQNRSWRVPDNLWREATPEQKEIFNELRRRG